MVWTTQNRERYDRRGQRYPGDLTNEKWVILGPLLPVPDGCGRPRRHLLREIMNGIQCVLRYGVPWGCDAQGDLLRTTIAPPLTGGEPRDRRVISHNNAPETTLAST